MRTAMIRVLIVSSVLLVSGLAQAQVGIYTASECGSPWYSLDSSTTTPVQASLQYGARGNMSTTTESVVQCNVVAPASATSYCVEYRGVDNNDNATDGGVRCRTYTRGHTTFSATSTLNSGDASVGTWTASQTYTASASSGIFVQCVLPVCDRLSGGCDNWASSGGEVSSLALFRFYAGACP